MPECMLKLRRICISISSKAFSGKGVHRMPIAGDTTRLPFANGLTPLERKMAWAQHFLAKHLGGTQQVRQLMGHTQFGARVTYGDCIFFMISPNEQHSALVLRLSRFRKNDPYVLYNEKPWGNLARESFPGLEAKRTRKDGAAEDIAEIEFPEYDLRRAAAARDPHAVVEAYKVEISPETCSRARCSHVPTVPEVQRLSGGVPGHLRQQYAAHGRCARWYDSFRGCNRAPGPRHAAFSREWTYSLRLPIWDAGRHSG